MTRSRGGPAVPAEFLPARGRTRGSGPLSAHSGAIAVEILATLVIAAALVAVAVPSVANFRSSVAVRSAAAEVSSAFTLARAYAVRRGVNVGLKFRKNGNRYEWALYRDGNGNGIRTAEITRGIDRPVGLAMPWSRGDVFPGFLKGTRIPDPSDPGHALTGLDDPIRFNSSDICSFSPVGECTPGSIYLSDGRDRMAVVRVFGRTAKIRTLYYRRGQKEWTP